MINPAWKHVYGHRAYFTRYINAYGFLKVVRRQRDNRCHGCIMLDDGGYVVMW